MAPERSDEQALAEQKAYYRARSPEYDDWWQRQGRYDKGQEFETAWLAEIGELRAALADFSPTGLVLELAGGTGNWSRELAGHAEHLTVVDQSPESLELNRTKLAEAGLAQSVSYIEADLFTLDPHNTFEAPGTFDVVFFSFWQSHVPESRFESFWAMVGQVLRPEVGCS